MANSNGWGDGASNNNIGWGKGANNAIGWGSSHATSYAGATDISGAPSTDPDAQAFITAAAITNPTQQAAINTLVVDLKGYSIWTKMKALYPFVGGTASAHKFNLKDPRDLDAAFRIFWNGGVTHSSNGVKFGGGNAYGNTHLSAFTVLGQNSNHISIYNRNTDLSSNGYHGSSPPNYFMIGRGGGSPANWEYWPNVSNYISPLVATPSNRFIIGTRTASNLSKLYVNGATANSATHISTSLPSQNFWFGALNSNGSGAYYNNAELAFASLGDGLTDTEAANLYTAVQAFQTTLGRSIGTQTVSDADAQAFVTNAGIVDQVEANAINNLVIGMKADGLWTKMKAVYPFVGGTSSTHKWNLKDPRDLDAAFRLVFSGGWTHSSTGALPNGTNGYADTFLTPSISLSLTSGHFSIYSRTNSAGGYDIGSLSIPGNIENGLISRYSNNIFYVKYGSTFLTTSSTDSRGHFINNRNSATNTKGIKNGIVLINSPETAALSTAKLFLSANNNTSFIPNEFSSKQLAFASIGDGLTDTEAANFYTAVQAFQISLNRNV